jgi:hypothetical protein
MVKKQWLLFKKVIKQYPQIFAENYVDRGIFFNLFGQVCTRMFSDSPTSTMIPMADCINHLDVHSNYELFNTDKHLDEKSDLKYANNRMLI